MRKRILWISLLITVLGLLLFSIVSAETYFRSQLEASKKYLKVYMNLYTDEVPFDEAGTAFLSEQMDGARVTFLLPDGTVVADSQATELNETHADRAEVISAIQTGEGFDIRNSRTIGQRYIYYCKRFENRLVRIAILSESEWHIFAAALPNVITFLLLDVVICFVFTYLLTGYILKPVTELSRQAASRKKCVTKYEELLPIADIMNRMNEEQDQSMKLLRREQDAVREAQESKNEFISNITHEMNTPLTSIRGYAEWLNHGTLNEEQSQRAAKIILEQSNRLSNLIACIINYNQIEHDSLPAYEVDLTKAIEEMLVVLEPSIAQSNLTLHRDIARNVIVLSRHERIAEVVGNILRNAIKYNKDGGEIFVRLTDGEHPVLVIRDTGIGIAPENQEKIFSRFFTVDKSHSGKHGGFGLGLAVVKKICDKSDWKLEFTSELDVGTSFTVTF